MALALQEHPDRTKPSGTPAVRNAASCAASPSPSSCLCALLPKPDQGRPVVATPVATEGGHSRLLWAVSSSLVWRSNARRTQRSDGKLCGGPGGSRHLRASPSRRGDHGRVVQPTGSPTRRVGPWPSYSARAGPTTSGVDSRRHAPMRRLDHEARRAAGSCGRRRATTVRVGTCRPTAHRRHGRVHRVHRDVPAARVFDVMDRRAFLGALGLVAAPLAAGAQRERASRIGFLFANSPDLDTETTGPTPGVPLLGPGARRGRA